MLGDYDQVEHYGPICRPLVIAAEAVVVGVLYFAEGVPLGFVLTTLNFYLRGGGLPARYFHPERPGSGLEPKSPVGAPGRSLRLPGGMVGAGSNRRGLQPLGAGLDCEPARDAAILGPGGGPVPDVGHPGSGGGRLHHRSPGYRRTGPGQRYPYRRLPGGTYRLRRRPAHAQRLAGIPGGVCRSGGHHDRFGPYRTLFRPFHLSRPLVEEGTPSTASGGIPDSPSVSPLSGLLRGHQLFMGHCGLGRSGRFLPEFPAELDSHGSADFLRGGGDAHDLLCQKARACTALFRRHHPVCHAV